MLRTTGSYALYGLGHAIILGLMIAGAIYWWPSFEENLGQLKIFASPMPMLGEMLGQMEQGGVAAYVVGQHYFKGCNTVSVGAAILFAAGAVAGEAHRGTLELWLARPVTRARLLTERYIGGLFATLAPVFATSLAVPLMLNWVDESMQLADLVRCSVHASALLAAIYSLTFLWSTRSSEPMRIVFVMLMFFVFQFAMYLVKVATEFSMFRFADIEAYMEIVMKNGLDWRIVAPLLLTSVVAYVLSLRSFLRRVP